MNFEEQVAYLEATKSRVVQSAVQARDRAALGRANAEKAEKVNKDLVSYNNAYESLRDCINRITSIYKNIERYAIDRKELSMEMLKIAIEKAGYIVPDADTSGIHLKTYEKSALIVNKDGQDVNLREGSAYRTVMGMLVRYTLLKAQPDKIQAVFLDEAFNTLSENTSATMREYFDVFKEDTLILGIEQRDTLFQGLDRKVFVAVKGQDGKTKIHMDEDL